MIANGPLRRPARPRPRGLGAAALTVVVLLVGVLGAAPSSAQDGPAPGPATMPGRGTTDSDQITLSGPASAPGAPTPRSGGSGPAAGETGWSTVVDLRNGTQMVALSWDGETSGPSGPTSGRVSLRPRSADGAWGAWLALAPDEADHGGDAGLGRVGSDVVWLGAEGADEVELRVDAGPLVGLELLRMRYHEGEPVPVEDAAAGAGRAGGSKAARPVIRPRSAWATRGWASGNGGCGSAPAVASRLEHAVVHHTATSNSYSQSQVPGLIDGIRRYHQTSLGWCDVAYNFVVDKYGGIWQGRDGDITKPVIGGHARGFNTYSTGVALLGQFEPGASPAAGTPTSAMIDSTARLLAWKLGWHGLDPDGTTTVTSGGSTRYSSGTRVTVPIINPHQETSTTACPGASMLSRLPALRSLTASYSQADGPGGDGAPTIDWSPFDSPEDLVYRQYVDFLRDPGTYTGRLWWHENLQAGRTTRSALVVSLLDSGQLQARSASVVRLYLAYFGRIPDHGGLRYWWGQRDAGLGLRSVSDNFALSPEFTSRYGQLSDAQFVDLVYRNVLGRAPDPDGYAFWTSRLASAESRGGLMARFSESSEHRAQRRDVVEVIITHEAMLQRSISAGSLFPWVARVTDDRIALISTLFASTEYAGRVG